MEQHDIQLACANALRTYCRGIDRLDAPTILRAFHPGAQLIDYGPEPMPIEAFVDRVLVSLGQRFIATQHRVSNIMVEIDASGTTATMEAYVLAFHVQQTDDGQRLHTFDGRYIDRCELRNGEWRIAQRHLRVDWSRIERIESPMGSTWVPSGRAGTPDPIWS
jgi:hypothetical protein